MGDFDSLDKAGRLAYFDAVSESHYRRVTLQWFRRSDGKVVGSITNAFLGGSISGDQERTPVTVMTCDLFDDEYALDWSHGQHRKYRVTVVDSRFIPALDVWVDRDVFTGPVWEFERSGPVVKLTVEGPEMEAMGSVRRADTWVAKTLATTALRQILSRSGANRLSIPRLKAKLPRDVTVGVRVGKDQNKKKDGFQGRKRQILRIDREDTWWGAAEPIADALDRDLFGDGSGRFVMASRKSRPSVTLDRRHLLAPVVEKRAQTGEVTNTWIGYGANPKGPRGRVHDRVELPKKHPASAWSQRNNGEPREVIVTVENKSWRTKRDVTRALRRRRDRGARETMAYEVEALPVVAWIRGGTLFSVPVAAGRAAARATQWDLPLGPGAEPMRIGVNRRRGYRK